MDSISPTPTPNPLLSASWLKPLLGLLSTVASNPVMAAYGIGGLIIVLGIAYLFFRHKINSWFANLAKRETQAGEENFLKEQVLKNQQNNEKDNAGRDKLDKTT